MVRSTSSRRVASDFLFFAMGKSNPSKQTQTQKRNQTLFPISKTSPNSFISLLSSFLSSCCCESFVRLACVNCVDGGKREADEAFAFSNYNNYYKLLLCFSSDFVFVVVQIYLRKGREKGKFWWVEKKGSEIGEKERRISVSACV